MPAHRGVGTELGEVQKGQIGTDALGYRLGQLDHWGILVLAIGHIQNGGTSIPDRSFGDSPPSGPQKRALGVRRGLRGLRFVRSFAQAGELVSDPPAELAARFYRMRWESECFFRTYKRVVKDVRLVSRTAPMVVREAEISLLACQLLLGQGALALKVGGKRAGRDEFKPQGSGGLSYYATMRYFKSRWNP